MGLDVTAVEYSVYMSTHLRTKAENKRWLETDKKFQRYSLHILIHNDARKSD